MTSSGSIQDPMRTLTKFHLSGNKQVSREQAAANKAAGYLTDGRTPVIGTMAHKMLTLAGVKATTDMMTHEEVFKQTLSWPQPDQHELIELFCREMGIDSSTATEWEERIRAVSSLDGFPVLSTTNAK